MIYVQIYFTVLFVIAAILVITDAITFNSDYRWIGRIIIHITCWLIIIMVFIGFMVLIWIPDIRTRI